MEEQIFGYLPNGKEVKKYTISNEKCSVSLIDFGAIVQSFIIDGVDIVGGFDTVEGYLKDTSHQGGAIGRVANRIANARFTMDGKVYELTKNDGEHCLHGGLGFDRKMWIVREKGLDYIKFASISDPGEEGFPALVVTEIEYGLQDTALTIEYTATSSGKTPISLTNHSYFNLDGLGGDILSHRARIYADEYTEVDQTLIPVGNKPVAGTVFDFNTEREIGERIGNGFEGYDHNYIIKATDAIRYGDGLLDLAAEVTNGTLTLEVYTDQPCVQFYIGNFLGEDNPFKGGIPQIKHGAFCLETQIEPDSVNHGVGFYDNGELYKHTTVYLVRKNS